LRALVRSLFDNVVRRRPTPYVLLFEPSQRCDCRCPFCYHWREHAAGELAPAGIRRVLDEAHALGCRMLLLGGGEPLVAPHLGETLAHAARRGYRTVVTTNGSRLAERAGEIAPLVARLSVSLDLPDERHDALRHRPGLFRAAVDGILAAARVGLEARITTNVTRDNLDDLPALARLARALGCRWHARLLTRESAANPDLPVLDATADRARYVATLRRLRGEGYPVATSERYLRTVATGGTFPCRIARFLLNVDALGRVYVPCPRHEGTKDLVFGRVGVDGSLRDLWYGPAAQAFRARTLACRPGVDCYSACVHDMSRVVQPDLRYWADELLDGASLSRFYLERWRRPGCAPAARVRGGAPR
jgi:MoaA/NifB/PqqE/SkfB family radical SAM enzyme